MRYLYLIVALLFALTAQAQTSDSLRVDYTQESTMSESTHSTERTKSEQFLLRRSRWEKTLFKAGFTLAGLYRESGLMLFNDRRPDAEKINTYGLLIGVEQKIVPAWAVHANMIWQFSSSNRFTRNLGSSWLGNLGVDYYFLLPKAIREGKSANNFYHNYYLTAEGWLPINDRVTFRTNGVERSVTINPYRQAVSVGIGLHSNRTRFYYYNTSLSVGYLFGRDEGLRHPVQLMPRISFGLGL